MHDYTAALQRGLAPKMGLINEAAEVMRLFTDDPVFLVGSQVYGTIVEQVYGMRQPETDYDFIILGMKPALIESGKVPQLPEGWKLGSIGDLFEYGLSKLHHGDEAMDFWCVRQMRDVVEDIQRRLPPPSIDEYLTTVPFTVQSIAYDIDNGRLVGDVGLQAIAERTIGVHHASRAKWYAKKRDMTVEKLLAERAERLGFSVSRP